MSIKEQLISNSRPDEIRTVTLPRREQFHASPEDWRNEILYFLLPDRFSDGKETPANLLDRGNLAAARPATFDLQKWAESGNEWQGGTIKGIQSKLPYLAKLGITCLWVGPVFKQRKSFNTYHGYGIQDFLEVDPRFGTREDLSNLVKAAHDLGLRVILDIVFNHSGRNWDYVNGEIQPPYRDFPGFYQKGDWLDADGNRVANISTPEDGVWPRELQDDDCYTRAGFNEDSLGQGALEDDQAEFKRADFFSMRDFNFDPVAPNRPNLTLNDLARCYKYWITVTDCDGFRLDTLKHMSTQAARNFCGTIKEFAANLGKRNFFLVGEVAGSGEDAGRYLDVLELNLNAALDIGEMRSNLVNVAKGFQDPGDYLQFASSFTPVLGSHRNSGPRHVTILNDHDHVSGEKSRFSTDGNLAHQIVAGVAIQLFSLGIPCIYYGTEQALAGPEKGFRKNLLSDFGKSDKYLRETMFGPENALLPNGTVNTGLPGFGAFGTVGKHCFDPDFPAFPRIAALNKVRQEFPVARYGRQYQRPISNFNAPFAAAKKGELITWSRILDDEEMLCVVNGNGAAVRGGDVMVASELFSPGSTFEVVVNTAQAAASAAYTGAHPKGQKLPVKQRGGITFVEIRDLPPSEVLILTNRTI